MVKRLAGNELTDGQVVYDKRLITIDGCEIFVADCYLEVYPKNR
jgi:hypothetical protein